MGLLTQVVGTVVNVVENATGNQGSGAGDWTEQQAANAEDAAQDAVDKVVESASDPVTFAMLMAQRVETRVGAWLTGGVERAGLPAPSRVDLVSLWGLTKEVVVHTARKVDTTVGGWLPSHVVDPGRRVAGAVDGFVQRGPAAVWGKVKAEIKSEVDGTDLLGKVRRWGEKMGTQVDDSSPVPAIVDLARWADDERLKLVLELRLAWAAIKSGVKGPLPGRQSPDLQRAYSRGPEGAELRRLSLELLAAAESGAVSIGPDAARHLAAAAAAAARGAALHAELLLWLAAIRRVAARSRQARRR